MGIDHNISSDKSTQSDTASCAHGSVEPADASSEPQGGNTKAAIGIAIVVAAIFLAIGALSVLTLARSCTGAGDQAPSSITASQSSAKRPAAQSSAGSTSSSDAHSSSALASSQNPPASASSEAAGSQASSQNADARYDTSRVVLGDEQVDAYLPLLQGKRVAVFSNQTGIVGNAIVSDAAYAMPALDQPGADLVPFGFDTQGNPVTYGPHIVDALLEHGVNVALAFAPEHGFRGTEDAGAVIGDAVDEATGVPIHSLYGNGGYPSDADMSAFDTLVIDLQDVGLRYYTYYLTMYHLLDACAAWGKQVVVLDRPNPNGFYVDGPILRDECRSQVGELPLPVVHGLTLGELALMMNGEGWLGAGANSCDLEVVPCLNYTHSTLVPLAMRPSPNIKSMRAVYLYASTCFFENTAISVARGTDFPFEAYGSPYLADVAGNDFAFVPQSIPGATNPPYLGEECYGVDLRDLPLDDILREGIDLSYLLDAYNDMQEAAPEVSFFGEPASGDLYWIDWLMGTPDVREQIEAGWSAAEIEAAWAEDVEAFRQQRAPYLLYEE